MPGGKESPPARIPRAEAAAFDTIRFCFSGWHSHGSNLLNPLCVTRHHQRLASKKKPTSGRLARKRTQGAMRRLEVRRRQGRLVCGWVRNCAVWHDGWQCDRQRPLPKLPDLLPCRRWPRCANRFPERTPRASEHPARDNYDLLQTCDRPNSLAKAKTAPR